MHSLLIARLFLWIDLKETLYHNHMVIALAIAVEISILILFGVIYFNSYQLRIVKSSTFL